MEEAVAMVRHLVFQHHPEIYPAEEVAALILILQRPFRTVWAPVASSASPRFKDFKLK